MTKKVYGICNYCNRVLAITTSDSDDIDYLIKCPHCNRMSADMIWSKSKELKKKLIENKRILRNKLNAYSIVESIFDNKNNLWTIHFWNEDNEPEVTKIEKQTMDEWLNLV